MFSRSDVTINFFNYLFYFSFFFFPTQKFKLKIGLFLLFLECHFFLTVCAGQVIKSAMKRVNNNNSSVYLLPKGLEGSVKLNSVLQKEIEEREKSK